MADAKRGQSRQQPDSDVSPQHLHLWQIQAVRDVMVIAAALALVWLGYAMRTVTVPLLVALLLAYLFEPLVAKLSKHPKLSRPMVVGGLLLTVGASVIAVLAIVVPLLVGQTIQLIDDARTGRFERVIVEVRAYVPESYRPEFDRVAQFLTPNEIDLTPKESVDGSETEEPGPADGGTVTPSLDSVHPDIASELAALRADVAALREQVQSGNANGLGASTESTGVIEVVRRALDVVFAVIGQMIAIGLLAFLIPFYFFFFSVWYPSVVKFGSDLIPPDRRGRVTDLLGKMDRAVAGFVRGRIVIAFIMSVMLAVGWQIVGVQYAIVLGFVIGFFSIVPYLGGVGLPLAIGLLWLGQAGEPEAQRMAWYWIIIWPSLVYGIVQVAESYFLTPMIAGKATNLDPVTILVAVLAGGAIMGVYGMLLAIPLAACLKILFMEVLLPRIRAWSAGNVADPLPIERD